jgi:hypothetical protein
MAGLRGDKPPSLVIAVVARFAKLPSKNILKKGFKNA